MTGRHSVLLDGPTARQNWEGDEVPEWTVGVVDENGDDIGKFYRVGSYSRAFDLAVKIAHDRRLPLDNEASQA